MLTLTEKNINQMFDYFSSLNSLILKRYEEYKKLSFIDYFMFQSTSYAISMLHNSLYFKEESMANIFILRSLIESFAVIKMFLAGDVTKESGQLIQEYSYIAEHEMYHRYPIFDGKLFFLKDIDENFEKAKQDFLELVKLSVSDFNHLVEAKMPFLLNHKSFDSIIKKYLSEFYQFYHIISILIHPSDLLITASYVKDNSSNFSLLGIELLFNLYKVVLIVYPDITITPTKTLEYEEQYVTANPINIKYMGFVKRQCNALDHLANNLRKKMDNNTQSNILEELSNYIQSMAIDKIYGYSEIVKCKIKPVMETLAISHYIGFRIHTLDNIYLDQLLTAHTYIQLNNVLGKDTSKEMQSSYELYKKADPNISYDDFKKLFNTNLGFIYEKTSIKKLVYNSIDDYFKIVPENALELKMFYDESQLLSHGNGYMLQSNTGAFMDSSPAIEFIDRTVSYYLNRYLNTWKAYDELEGNHHNEKTIHDINKCLKEFHENGILKTKMDNKYKDSRVSY